jgi:hypothetical protein
MLSLKDKRRMLRGCASLDPKNKVKSSLSICKKTPFSTVLHFKSDYAIAQYP